MKKSTLVALVIAALSASVAYGQRPVIQTQYTQPLCVYPARWVWRGFWSCEYAAPVYYPRHAYVYPYRYYGGHVGGGRGHPGGHHGGHR